MHSFSLQIATSKLEPDIQERCKDAVVIYNKGL